MKTLDYEATALALNRMIEKRHLNFEKVAKKCGLASTTVSRWANGEAAPKLKYLVSLLDVLDCDFDDIVKTKEVDE